MSSYENYTYKPQLSETSRSMTADRPKRGIHKRLYNQALSQQAQNKKKEKREKNPKKRKLPRKKYLKIKRKQNEFFERHYQMAATNRLKTEAREKEKNKNIKRQTKVKHITAESSRMASDRGDGKRRYTDFLYEQAIKKQEKERKEDEEIIRSLTPAPPKKIDNYEDFWKKDTFVHRMYEYEDAKQRKREEREKEIYSLMSTPPTMSAKSEELTKNREPFWKTIL
mmetsp:Transcript_8514/g.12554  ORF Transcript_8514/g.12554 Transcript_8514/m.12554 type:complete len:225 (-) Transcript_8514:7-681(-)